MCNIYDKLYEDVYNGYIHEDGNFVSWPNHPPTVHDPLVQEVLQWRDQEEFQRELWRKALLCIMFGWIEPHPPVGTCYDEECPCMEKTEMGYDDWPCVATWGYHKTNSFEWGEGAEWTSCYVHPCEGRYQICIGWDGYP